MSHILIIGASQAGSQLAFNLRDRGFEGAVTLVGEEPEWPYQRPPLSKAFLAGTADRETLMLRDTHLYAEKSIDVILGVRVLNVDMTAHTAELSDGRTLNFDKVAFTTGARVRHIPVPGAELQGICYLRNVGDADQLKEQLPAATNVVIVGGGFIGLEAAAVCAAMGKTTTVLEAQDRLLARAVAPAMSDFYATAHRKRGVDVRLGAGVQAFEGDGTRVMSVVLSDGSKIAADVVIVGIGVIPNSELAANAGIECSPAGIVVDRFARTSHPDAVAAGDCTVLPNPRGEGMIRLESVQNAVDQTSPAAASLLGLDEEYTKVPWFWSDQADLKLQIAGLNTGYDHTVVRGEMTAEKFSVLYFRDGQLLSIDAINSPADFLTIRKMLTNHTPLSIEAAEDLTTPLKAHAN